MFETQYEALRRQGVSRRSFLQFCSLTAASLGLGSAGAQEIAQAIETKLLYGVVYTLLPSGCQGFGVVHDFARL